MIFRTFIENIEVLQPGGLDRLPMNIGRNSTASDLLEDVSATLEFKGNGYEILRSYVLNDPFSEKKIRITVEDTPGLPETFFEGLIKTSHIKLNELTGEASVKPMDDSYYARINNNKSVETLLWLGRSKNDAEIDPCELYQVEFFDVASGVYHRVNADHHCGAYRVHEIYRYLTDFLSDKKLSFRSDHFSATGPDAGFCVTIGLVLEYVLGTGTGGPALSEAVWQEEWPKINWSKFHDEMYKARNIAFTIEESPAGKTLRVEPESFFYENGITLVIKNIEELIIELDQQKLYSLVNVGSSNTFTQVCTPDDVHFPKDLPYEGFRNDSYIVAGNQNDDRTLNLVGEFIRDSNVIESEINGCSNDYSQEFHFVETDYIDDNNGKAIQTPSFSGGGYFYYNDGLRNKNILERFKRNIAANLSLYNASPTNNFRARKTANTFGSLHEVGNPPVELVASQFIDDNSPPHFFDPANNYDQVNSKYEIPILSDGNYTFYVLYSTLVVFIDFNIIPIIMPGDCKIGIKHYDSGGYPGGVLKGEVSTQHALVNAGSGYKIYTANCPVNAVAGDKLYPFIRYWSTANDVSISMQILGNINDPEPITPGVTPSFWECRESVTAGGVKFITEPHKARIYKYKFERNISWETFKQLRSGKRGKISIESGASIRTGWIDQLKATVADGSTRFELIGAKEN